VPEDMGRGSFCVAGAALALGQGFSTLALSAEAAPARLRAQDMHNELQEVMGQSFGVPEDVDEEELMGELDALEDELAMEAERPAAAGGVPAYMQARHTSGMA